MTITQKLKDGAKRLKFSESDNDATMTSQYVRLLMFVLVVVLGVSIALATFRSGGGREGSISDYFHTPARLALVATLVAIGVSLMALYSSDPVENFLLNAAGTFAPIIGFAATTQATGSSAPYDFDVLTADVDTLARTSLPAYFAALLLLACFVYFVHPKDTRVRKSIVTVAVVVLVAAATWFVWEHWPRKVHVVAAVGFFVPLIILIFSKAFGERVGNKLKWTYLTFSILMIASGVWYWIDQVSAHSKYATFIVESVLIAFFAAFWLLEYVRIAPRTEQLARAEEQRQASNSR